jgi:hypothetical protein
MSVTEKKPRPEGAEAEPFTEETDPWLFSDGVRVEHPLPPPTAPAQSAPPRPAPAPRPAAQLFVPLLLIGLGVAFLAGNVLTIGGGMVFIGLGLVFLVARIVWNNYGLAVPAGILLGFGGFVALSEADWLPTSPDTAQGGWFFLLLALGFAAIYLIGARPAMFWPFFPAAVLAAFGLLLLGRENLAPFERFADYGKYWPVALIAVGGYLLGREHLPREVRKPLALTGTIALVAYGLLVLAGGLARSDFELGDLRSLGINTSITRTEDLSTPVGAGDLVRINNVSGRTVVQTGAAGTVRVQATKHLWSDSQVLDIQLVPAGDVVALSTSTGSERYFGNSPYADFVVTVPTDSRVEITSSSGSVEVRGVSGAVSVTTSSGSVTIDAIDGPVTARSSSGALRLGDIAGDLYASTSSGSIRATGIDQPREVTSSSGSISVEGVFAGNATIRSTSGSVTIGLAPGSSARIEATTSSGAIRDSDITLTGRDKGSRSLSGALGDGTGLVTIATSSGSITLTNAR